MMLLSNVDKEAVTGIKRLTTADDNESMYSSATFVLLKISLNAATPLPMIALLNSIEKSIRYKILVELFEVFEIKVVSSLWISTTVAMLETFVTQTGVRLWLPFVSLLNRGF